ncbi:DAK2 domain-containing protein [Streptomyces sp. O3]
MHPAQAWEHALAGGMSDKDALGQAVEAARAGAASTTELLPRRGRSSYLGERAMGYPDPGAVAVTVWMTALADTAG